MYGFRFEEMRDEEGKVTGLKMVFPTGKTDEERDERYVTENEFLEQMRIESCRCSDAVLDAHRALIWNAINTVLIVATTLITLLM